MAPFEKKPAPPKAPMKHMEPISATKPLKSETLAEDLTVATSTAVDLLDDTPPAPPATTQSEIQAIVARIDEIDARLIEIAGELDTAQAKANATEQRLIAAMAARPVLTTQAHTPSHGDGPFTFPSINRAQVPAEYLTDGDPDKQKMQAACLRMEAAGEDISIPGVQIGRAK